MKGVQKLSKSRSERRFEAVRQIRHAHTRKDENGRTDRQVAATEIWKILTVTEATIGREVGEGGCIMNHNLQITYQIVCIGSRTADKQVFRLRSRKPGSGTAGRDIRQNNAVGNSTQSRFPVRFLMMMDKKLHPQGCEKNVPLDLINLQSPPWPNISRWRRWSVVYVCV